MRDRKARLRILVQLACFVAALLLLVPLPGFVKGLRFIPHISPFVAGCVSLAGKGAGAGLGIGLVFAVIAVVRPRFFCRYLCPTGFLLQKTADIGFRENSWWRRCPPIGNSIVIVTVISALVGYPLLLWMDPLAIFASSLSIYFVQGIFPGILTGLLLGILLLLSLTSGDLWCARMCPLGAAQDLLYGIRRLFRKSREEPIHGPISSAHPRMLVRRVFLVGTIGIGAAFWSKKIGAARGEKAPLRPPGAQAESQFTGSCIRCGSCIRVCPSNIIHPDGGAGGFAGLAAPVLHFGSGYCLEDCSQCTQVCPSGAITPMNLVQKRSHRIGEALVDSSLCLLILGKKDCDACERACPFDAIGIHWDENQYIAYPSIETAKCNGCDACESACPTGDFRAIRVWRNLE